MHFRIIRLSAGSFLSNEQKFVSQIDPAGDQVVQQAIFQPCMSDGGK